MNMPENKFARISKLKKMHQSEQHPDTDQAFKKTPTEKSMVKKTAAA